MINLLRQIAGLLVFVVAKVFILPHATLAVMLLVHEGLMKFRCVVAGHVPKTDDFMEMKVTYCSRCGEPNDETRVMMSDFAFPKDEVAKPTALHDFGSEHMGQEGQPCCDPAGGSECHCGQSLDN